MNTYQHGTSNTISQTEVPVGSGMTVWSRVGKKYQSGGYIDTADLNPGDIIPAGAPAIFNGPGQQVIPVTGSAATKANMAKVNGLIENDVCIPTGVAEASCAVVYDGKVYANRANGGNGLPASLKAQLSAIEFIYEGEAPAEPES